MNRVVTSLPDSARGGYVLATPTWLLLAWRVGNVAMALVLRGSGRAVVEVPEQVRERREAVRGIRDGCHGSEQIALSRQRGGAVDTVEDVLLKVREVEQRRLAPRDEVLQPHTVLAGQLDQLSEVVAPGEQRFEPAHATGPACPANDHKPITIAAVTRRPVRMGVSLRRSGMSLRSTGLGTRVDAGRLGSRQVEKPDPCRTTPRIHKTDIGRGLFAPWTRRWQTARGSERRPGRAGTVVSFGSCAFGRLSAARNGRSTRRQRPSRWPLKTAPERSRARITAGGSAGWTSRATLLRFESAASATG